MTAHQMHEDHGVHGMLLFGEDTLYLSHLPMFMGKHDRQIILEITLVDREKDVHAVYRADQEDSGERVYTLVPEAFALHRLGAAGDDALRSFTGSVFRGHFEKGGQPILRDVRVDVAHVIHFRRFDRQAEPLPELQYLLFGRGDELYLAHLITKAPDFDQIAPVSSISHGFSDETLRRGVRLSFPGRSNGIRERLRGGDQADARVELALETARELYLEEGELAERVDFGPTDEEKEAGFN